MLHGIRHIDFPAVESWLLANISNSFPAGPTKGRPCWSSWSPGCSPIIMIATLGFVDSAPVSNSPKTACVAFRYIDRNLGNVELLLAAQAGLSTTILFIGTCMDLAKEFTASFRISGCRLISELASYGFDVRHGPDPAVLLYRNRLEAICLMIVLR